MNNSPASLKSNKIIIEESVSEEENEEEPPPPSVLPCVPFKEEKPSKNRSSMERLDSQVSTLHQDVATLSLEVRNAIHALQEMAYSTLTHIDNHVPARSIPNLQNGTNEPHMVSEYLTRSSSQPAEVWHRNNNIKSISDLYW